MNLTTIAREHYLPAMEKRNCPDTADGYRSSIELHVLPRFGEMELEEIEHEDVQDWVNEIAPECGVGGAEKAWKCLRQIFNWAMKKWKLRLWNPCTDVKMPRKTAYKPEVLTTRRLKKLVRGFVGHEFEPTLIISAALGLRPGDNYFLSWSDINWRTGLVPIRGTYRWFKGKSSGNSRRRRLRASEIASSRNGHSIACIRFGLNEEDRRAGSSGRRSLTRLPMRSNGISN